MKKIEKHRKHQEKLEKHKKNKNKYKQLQILAPPAPNFSIRFSLCRLILVLLQCPFFLQTLSENFTIY